MKKFSVLILCIIMGIMFAGCNISQMIEETATSSEKHSEKQDVSEEESDNIEEESEAESTEEVVEESTESYVEISIGETVSVSGQYDFCVDSVDFVTTVLPAQPGQFHLKYEAEEGRAYVDCVFLYTNSSTSDIAGNQIVDGVVKYADTFSYIGAKTVLEEEDRSDFMFAMGSTIAVGESRYVHCYLEVPEEVMTSTGKVEVVLTLGEESYRLVAREGDDAEALGISPKGEVDTSGSIEVGKVYATETAEFSVEYAEFKQKVMAPNSGNFYMYYEADADLTYLDICIPYKNYGKEAIFASEVFEASLLCEDGTTYEGDSIVEDENRTDLTYSNITEMQPLMQEYIHLLFEVPQSVAESGSVQVTIKVDDKEYVLEVK